MIRDVACAPIAEAVAASGESMTDIAMRLDWFTHHGRADGPRVRRRLGLLASAARSGPPVKQTHMSYNMAVAICRAALIDPFEVGL